MMGGISSQSDFDHVKRQLDDLQRELDLERQTTGKVIDQQEKEIEDCKKELDTYNDNDKKLKSRAKELQDELEYTLKRIEQLQRGGGAFTPVRRRASNQGSNASSKGASPYNRSGSGAKRGTPGNSVGSGTRVPAYTRPTLSNPRVPVTQPNRISPNRFGAPPAKPAT